MKDALKNKFIVDETTTREDAEQLIEKALKYGRVSKSGDIIIDKVQLSQDNILRLALVLRFLAHGIDESITESVRPTELTKVMGERVESVGSRLSQLAKSGFAKKSGYGQYVVHSYKVDKFLDELESGTVEIEVSDKKHPGKKKTKRVATGGKQRVSSVGAGADIQALIEEDFFKTPKFLIEKYTIKTSRQAIEYALKQDRHATHKNNSGYKLMESGRKQLKELKQKEEVVMIEAGKPFSAKNIALKDIFSALKGE